MVHAPGALVGPDPLRSAPPRGDTPLPATFGLVEDGATKAFDGGRVLLGGSPLRLMRLSERAGALVERWRHGQPVGRGRGAGLLARRLVSAGVFDPQPPRTSPAPSLSVVIPARDRPAELERLLSALAGLDCVVVDDGSADPARTAAVCHRHGARLVTLPDNVGPAGARNAGLAVIDTELVAFVDSDCVPAAGWLEPLLAHFDDPLIAAVAPRIVARPAPSAGAIAGYEVGHSSLDRGAAPGPVRPGGAVPFVPSAALIVRADLAEGERLFDPSLRAGEDVDLVWRLAAAGWDVRYEPASTVEHDGATTALAFLSRRAFYGTSAGPLAVRHGAAMAPLEVSAWTVSVWALAALRHPVVALGAQATAVALLARRLDGLVRDPVLVATRIAGGGTARSAGPALAALTRTWSPLLVFGLAFRRTRRTALLALLLPAVRDGARNPVARGAGRDIGLHIADDVAYGLGVWTGCVRARTAIPLLPRLVWRSRSWSPDTLRRDLERGDTTKQP